MMTRIFKISFTKQLICAWLIATIILLLMFYIYAPFLGHVFVIPVVKYSWASFLSSHTFWANAYRGLIWLCYFIPLLYALNVVFTFIIYLCINNEMIHQEDTSMYLKIALINSIKVLFVQLPVAAIVCAIVPFVGVTKTVVILTPFSTEVVRVVIFSLWLISLIIIQTALALKITLKSSLHYSLLLMGAYKFTWIIFTLLFFNISFNIAKGLVYLLPNFINNDFFSNLCLTGFALAIYVIIIAFLLHYLFKFEKPFELESEEL